LPNGALKSSQVGSGRSKPREDEMSVTYYVALPFVPTEDGLATGRTGVPNENAAIRKAEAMSRKPPNVGALAFKRTGDPSLGNYGDATVLKTYGEVPKNLDEL
jgi:hypothetical protein